MYWWKMNILVVRPHRIYKQYVSLLIVLVYIYIYVPLNLWYKLHLSRHCWSLRCSWSIACQWCSNYIFIHDLTPGGWFNVHDDVIKWKNFLRYWPFVLGIYQWIPLTKDSDAELWCFFDLRRILNKLFSKQSWGWWFETPSRSLWPHCNERCNLTSIGNTIVEIRSYDCLISTMGFPILVRRHLYIENQWVIDLLTALDHCFFNGLIWYQCHAVWLMWEHNHDRVSMGVTNGLALYRPVSQMWALLADLSRTRTGL